MNNSYPFKSVIATYSKLYGLEPSVVAAIIKRESNFDPTAIGDSGLAIGLMQLHPAACVAVGEAWNEMNIAENNIRAGCKYLALMLKICGNDLKWALAAYNQGPTAIARGKKYSEEVIALCSELS